MSRCVCVSTAHRIDVILILMRDCLADLLSDSKVLYRETNALIRETQSLFCALRLFYRETISSAVAYVCCRNMKVSVPRNKRIHLRNTVLVSRYYIFFREATNGPHIYDMVRLKYLKQATCDWLEFFSRSENV